MMAEPKGVIYILTNPSFPDYVKIGYADDVERRLTELNRSECIPYAFRIYATYEVSKRLGDLSLHRLIDKLNPTLRAIDTFNGKPRKKEFYAMSKEEAYFLLETIAEIHDSVDKLKIWEPKQEEIQDETVAEEVKLEKQARSSNFLFSDYHIPVGAILSKVDEPSVMCTVVDDRRISYNGEIMYITPFARVISGKNYITKGPRYLVNHFEYNGILLKDICDEIDNDNTNDK